MPGHFLEQWASTHVFLIRYRGPVTILRVRFFNMSIFIICISSNVEVQGYISVVSVLVSLLAGETSTV